jgi:hypothetical protein
LEHLNVFIAQIAVLLLPGIIWARLDVRYAIKEKPSEFDFVLRAFVYGLASYAVTFALYSCLKQPFALIDVAEAQAKTVITQQIGGEILAATAIGFILGVLWVYASTWKILTHVLQFIRATNRYGDEDVWDFTFNSTEPSVRFVNVRDFEKRIVYTGRVNAFSETGKLRELTLYEVEIYDFEGNFMYEVPRLYLARKPDDIHIEFPLTDRVHE